MGLFEIQSFGILISFFPRRQSCLCGDFFALSQVTIYSMGFDSPKRVTVKFDV